MVAVLLTLLVLLQFPADFGSVAHAAQKNEIRGTISVASNISQQDMQQYLDGFNKKYPGIEVKYSRIRIMTMRCQNRFSLGAVYMTEKVPYEKLFKEADSVLYDVKTRGKTVLKFERCEKCIEHKKSRSMGNGSGFFM